MWLIGFAVFLVVLLAAFFLLTNNSMGEETKRKVLEIAGTNDFVQQLIVGQGFETKITRLDSKGILELRAKDALYDNLPEKTLYRVNYDSAVKGSYVVIVDLEQNKVLKFFRIASISVGAS